MKLFTKIDDTLQIQVSGKTHPVTVCGNGLPLLAIGIGTLMQRTLSDRFKRSFKVYSTDLYWVREGALPDESSITMANVVDDVVAVARQLGLRQFFIIGHSAFGIVALEVAKAYPDMVLGIIASGMPTNSNPQVAADNDAFFNAHADPIRKALDVKRRAEFAALDLQGLSVSEACLKSFVERDAPRFWHDPAFNCWPVWSNVHPTPLFADRFYSVLLPPIDATKDLSKVHCPVFLAAGVSDYDCCPFLWKDVPGLPAGMHISVFKASGHWPHYEEGALFDARIEEWLSSCGFRQE